MSIRIREVDTSAWADRHINGKHGVTLDEVEQVLEPPYQAKWIFDEARGQRLAVLGTTETGRRLQVILFPVYEAQGRFELRTAFEKRGERADHE